MPHRTTLGAENNSADVIDKKNKNKNLTSSLGPISNSSLGLGATSHGVTFDTESSSMDLVDNKNKEKNPSLSSSATPHRATFSVKSNLAQPTEEK